MLDVKQIREDPDAFRAGLARRNLGDVVDDLLAADERRRSLTQRVEELRAAQNRASKAIGRATGDQKQRLIAEVATVSAELKELEPQLAEAEAHLNALLASTPNVPHPSSPDGFTDEDAVEVRRNHGSVPAACSTWSARSVRAARGSSTCSATSRSSSSRWSEAPWTSWPRRASSR